jgi:hypothetical protein
MTVHSIYSQLPSISAGRLLHPQNEDVPCHAMVTRDPPKHGFSSDTFFKEIIHIKNDLWILASQLLK